MGRIEIFVRYLHIENFHRKLMGKFPWPERAIICIMSENRFFWKYFLFYGF